MKQLEEQTGLPLSAWVRPVQRAVGLSIVIAGLTIQLASAI